MTLRMTAEITQMKRRRCVAVSTEPAQRASSAARTANAFQTDGAATMTTTVGTNLMKRTVVNILVE